MPLFSKVFFLEPESVAKENRGELTKPGLHIKWLWKRRRRILC